MFEQIEAISQHQVNELWSFFNTKVSAVLSSGLFREERRADLDMLKKYFDHMNNIVDIYE